MSTYLTPPDKPVETMTCPVHGEVDGVTESVVPTLNLPTPERYCLRCYREWFTDRTADYTIHRLRPIS